MLEARPRAMTDPDTGLKAKLAALQTLDTAPSPRPGKLELVSPTTPGTPATCTPKPPIRVGFVAHVDPPAEIAEGVERSSIPRTVASVADAVRCLQAYAGTGRDYPVRVLTAYGRNALAAGGSAEGVLSALGEIAAEVHVAPGVLELVRANLHLV
ncbi:uncharacterized protein LOC62_05G007542 [Vanrija pseudolonga]|uniref:Uncharacterized protein n=1 Tax=Vanrija pseudolonga TaxID=143232 RepID=A0AAF0YC56_9TREE|nr:hypothetical protein LOC62_05G007542 [Vanrija pseudolonga]